MPTSHLSVLSIDQGTTSSRALLFNHNSGETISSHSVEFTQFYPKTGYAEHDPEEILHSVLTACEKVLSSKNEEEISIDSVGLTNQRETIIFWDRYTGKVIHKGIVWLDTRNKDYVEHLIQTDREFSLEYFPKITGLKVSTYFSAFKIAYWIDREIHEKLNMSIEDIAARVCVGTVDSWLIYRLTGHHVVDVTNASRYGLLNLVNLKWDLSICEKLKIPVSILPNKIISNKIIKGRFVIKGKGGIFKEFPLCRKYLNGVSICSSIGDQSAALIGQSCVKYGQTKSTFGTGCFVMINTGNTILWESRNLLKTIGYWLDPEGEVDPMIGLRPNQIYSGNEDSNNYNYFITYALEGAIACAGRTVQWVRDSLNLVSGTSEFEALANSVDDADGVVIVPAFAGLFAPHWRSDLTGGQIVNLRLSSTRAHLCKAVLYSVAHQLRDILREVNLDLDDYLLEEDGLSPDRTSRCHEATRLIPIVKVDGGMCANKSFLQICSNLIGDVIYQSCVIESTAFGAALLCMYNNYNNNCNNDNFSEFIDEKIHGLGGYVDIHPNCTQFERDREIERWEIAVKQVLN